MNIKYIFNKLKKNVISSKQNKSAYQSRKILFGTRIIEKRMEYYTANTY